MPYASQKRRVVLAVFVGYKRNPSCLRSKDDGFREELNPSATAAERKPAVLFSADGQITSVCHNRVKSRILFALPGISRHRKTHYGAASLCQVEAGLIKYIKGLLRSRSLWRVT